MNFYQIDEIPEHLKGYFQPAPQIGLEPLHDCLAWARQEPPCGGCYVCSLRAAMENEAGQAFEHYIRTDDNGARPVPDGLLELWIGRGWLSRVAVPASGSSNIVPCTVLDPFLGSGTTIMVALQNHRRGIGIELNEEYVEICKKRIEQGRLKAGFF